MMLAIQSQRRLESNMSELFNNVKPGDMVHYKTPQGQHGKGKVVLRYDTHVVVNRGKGQPQVVNDKNYVKHERGGKVIGALLSRLKEEEVNETRSMNGPYGGHPYDWDPELRKAIFAGMAKKKGKPTGPKDNGRPYVPTKSGPPPRRGTPSLQGEDSHDAEGHAARIEKSKKKKKLHEVSSGTLASYVSKAIADRKKQQGMADQAQRIHTPERAKYFIDKAASRAAKRSKGIKTAVGKIANSLPAEPLKQHSDNEGSRHGGWSGMEGRESRSEYTANMAMSGGNKQAKGHYLMKDGRKLSGPHEPHEAVKAYKGLADSKGVKIVHVKEGVETDVTNFLMEADASKTDKYKKAAQKAISLSKKAKGNKHVDTEPKLELQDKGGNGPIESNHKEENDGKL
jgi:hypothetical protein